MTEPPRRAGASSSAAGRAGAARPDPRPEGASGLDRLAERLGVEPEFRDAAGAIRRTEPEVARALLEALGFDVADDREAAEALSRLEAEEARRPLPPVVATAPGARFVVSAAPPWAGGAIRWAILDEEGGRREGEIGADALAPPEGGRVRVALQAPERPGRCRLRIERSGEAAAETTLIVAPETCWLPEALLEGGRLWGVSIQLYLLRSATNWGIGDFGDLRRFVGVAAGLGADMVGLNPLHAMFLDDPEHASPYSPASRLFLNVLYIDVPAIPGYDAPSVRALVEAEAFRARLAGCREAAQVDYAGVAALKRPALEALHAVFRAEAPRAEAEAFAAFRHEQGEALERFCLYQALRERFVEDGVGGDWRNWPEPFRDARSEEVARFAETTRGRIDFFAWTQWIADRQLGEAAAEARAQGMAVGLYRDLAVGADGGGAEGWTNPGVVLSSVHVGAPPDILNPAGQDWALPPFDPRALREEAYASFAALVAANMRHAGGLRIDHVMALQHLYLIPEGRPSAKGAYVAYPMDEMIAALALESRRRRCLVVGEDLGTVPEGFRERMEAARILSYRVVFFERDADGAFAPPEAYPPLALAVLGSHDLATLRGWWEGRDIGLKARHGLYPDAEEEARQRAQREAERVAFLAALREAGLLGADAPGPEDPFDVHLDAAAHAFLASARSGLAVAQLDDLLGEADQVNLPGTTDQHPNWRRRHRIPLEALAAEPGVRALADALGRGRRSAARRAEPPPP